MERAKTRWAGMLLACVSAAAAAQESGGDAQLLGGWGGERSALHDRIDGLAAVGLFYVGPFDWRPLDELGFAAGRSHVNGRVAAGERTFDASLLPGSALVQGSEYPFELFYGINFTPALSLRPDLQYIHQPGGSSRPHDDLVLGMKLALTL